MTNDKFNDLHDISLKYRENPEALDRSHIILPDSRVFDASAVQDTNRGISNFNLTPLFGYTQKYKVEKKTGISTLSTNRFIEQIETLREGIHEVLSNNSVGITDDNPHNLLVSSDDEIFLIDHDRDTTKNSTSPSLEDASINSFYDYNDEKLDNLINKALILEAFRGMEPTDENFRKVLLLLNELMLQKVQGLYLYSLLNKYGFISEFASDKAKELGLKM